MNGLWARRAPERAGRSPRGRNEAVPALTHESSPSQFDTACYFPGGPLRAPLACSRARRLRAVGLLRSWECGRGEWWERTRAEVRLARVPRRDGCILQIPRRVWTDESVPVMQARKQASWRCRLHQLELQNYYSATKRSSVFRRLTCFRGCPMNRKP
jgi:hypothetical protein